MNKRINVLLISVALIMCMTVFAISAYAAAEPTTAPAPVDPAPTSTPVDPAPTSAPAAPTSAPAPSEGNTPAITDPTVDPNQGIIEDPTTDAYVEPEATEYYYYDEDEMVNNIDGTAGNVSDYTNLYDTSDFDEKALEESKWDDIALDISEAKGDAMDFSAIKENTSQEDDGEWIIYTGFTLIGLALLGILYFTIATITYKKKLKKLKAREQRQRQRDQQRPRNDYGDSDEFPSVQDYNRHYQRNRYAPSGGGYAERKRRNADTAEIDIPRRYISKH